jgi:hypothetical protein
MGVPYPNGLDSLQETKPHLLPWAWGMNGGLSLVGGSLARLLSVSSGFPVLLRVGIVVYAAVGCLFPINLIMTRDKVEKVSVPQNADQESQNASI